MKDDIPAQREADSMLQKAGLIAINKRVEQQISARYRAAKMLRVPHVKLPAYIDLSAVSAWLFALSLGLLTIFWITSSFPFSVKWLGVAIEVFATALSLLLLSLWRQRNIVG